MDSGLFIQEPAKSIELLFKKPDVVLFTGPMFVGKTTTMFKAVADRADKGDHSVIIKPGMDNRGSFDTIFTHDGDKKNQNVSIIVADTIQKAFLSLPILAIKSICLTLPISSLSKTAATSSLLKLAKMWGI